MPNNLDIDELIKTIEESKLRMDTFPYSWDRQDNCHNGSDVNGPTMYRGVPYHPMAFKYKADQINQAIGIIEKFNL